MDIRPARFDDIPALVSLGEQMHAESPRFSRFAFAPEKCAEFARGLIESPQGFVFVAETGSEIIGLFAGFKTEHFFSFDRMASDVAVFVLPAHRGGSAFLRLLRAFEAAVAEGEDKLEIILGISTEVHTAQTAELYAKLGYSSIGASMGKVVGDV